METISAFSLPPGFGFHPTDVELISHYLKGKILGLNIDFKVIPEVDIYKYEPWDLPAKCHIPTRDSKWHFFTSRDRKYPNGSRTNRATEAGYWKSTGKDRNIKSHNQVIGTKKTLVFHKGRPPCGKRTDWIMHEYYMNENGCKAALAMKDIFVLCRVTKRNGLPFDSEHVSPKTEELDTCPKPLKDVAVPVVQEESPVVQKSSSPSENVEDFEAWFAELYDPDFCAMPTIGELKNEPKISQEDVSSLALKQEPIDSIPKFSEVLHLLQSGDDIYRILQSDIHESSFIDRNDNESAAFDPTASAQPNDNIDAGILLREHRARPIDIPSYRLKLQVHKMESKDHVNQTLQFVNQDHHLDLNDGTQYPSRIEVEEKRNPGGSTDSVVSKSDPSRQTASETSHILMSQAHAMRERSDGGPLNVGRSSCTHPDDMSCIQGLVRGLFIFSHWCSSAGLNCFFLGACMVGTAAVILYFLLRDAQRFLGSFSDLGL